MPTPSIGMPQQPAVDVVFLHPDDNVCVAARNLEAGTELAVDGRTCTLSCPVKLGHKIALYPISEGHRVLKYGQAIGVTIQDPLRHFLRLRIRRWCRHDQKGPVIPFEIGTLTR